MVGMVAVAFDAVEKRPGARLQLGIERGGRSPHAPRRRGFVAARAPAPRIRASRAASRSSTAARRRASSAMSRSRWRDAAAAAAAPAAEAWPRSPPAPAATGQGAAVPNRRAMLSASAGSPAIAVKWSCHRSTYRLASSARSGASGMTAIISARSCHGQKGSRRGFSAMICWSRQRAPIPGDKRA